MDTLIIISMALGIVGTVGMGFGVMAFIEVRALKQSTHKIQWVPIDNPVTMDKTAPQVDNSPVAFDDDDLFTDDIDLYLDKQEAKKARSH